MEKIQEHIVKDPQVSKKDKALLAIRNPFLIRREINDRSLYEFIKYFWDEICNDDFIDNWHLQVFCKELEEIAYRVGNNEQKLYDLIVNVPPGMTKTIVFSIMFPAWCWTKWFWMRFICASYTAPLALESAEYSRDLIKSKKFQAVYPDLDIKEDKDNKSNFKIIKKLWVHKGFRPRIINGGNRYSTSVNGSVLGFHAHIQIVDDALDPKRAASVVELQKANRWCDGTLSTRKTNKKVSTLIIVMQRLHQDDPCGHLLEKAKRGKKKIKHLCLPGEIRNYSKFVSPPELIEKYSDDQLLDSKRLDWKALEEMEADLGQYGFAGQVGQNPVPPGGGMFKVDRFVYVTHIPGNNQVIKKFRYWDKAATVDAGCFTVGVLMWQLINGKYLIVDVKRGQWSSEDREAIMRATAEADGADVSIGIEQEPGSSGKDSAAASIKNLAGFHVILDSPHGDKPYRADPFSVQVNNGNVLLLQADWNHDYIEEFRFFPYGTYKDQVDASSGAFNQLASKRIAGNAFPKDKR